MAKSAGKDKEALACFSQCDLAKLSPDLKAGVLQAEAEILLDRGDTTGAVGQLETLLKLPSFRGRPAASALCKIGEIHLAKGEAKKAIPYFQRIYVMYGRWPDCVARAYWLSGQAFEQLEMQNEALNTYREFVANNALKETAEYTKAKQRLEAL